tara:strand:- start:742 stop:909 length:168 start_codon:yes stop_codon:yes gene_type:complete
MDKLCDKEESENRMLKMKTQQTKKSKKPKLVDKEMFDLSMVKKTKKINKKSKKKY